MDFINKNDFVKFFALPFINDSEKYLIFKKIVKVILIF